VTSSAARPAKPGTVRARPLARTRPRIRFHEGKVGAAVLAVIIVLVIVVPLIASRSVNLLGIPFQRPSLHHLFGTDDIGRDVFVRTMAGGRIDLCLAFGGVALSVLIGTTYGTIAGMLRVKWLDSVLMRIVDAFIAFPFILLVLVLVVIIGPRTISPIPPGLPAIFIGLVATDWAWYARLARAQALSLRDADFVVAGRLLGFSLFRLVRHHLMPSVIRVNIAYAVGDAIQFVITAASLAFLGAGVEPPTPEWGAIMYEGRAYLQTAWWITLLPGLVLAITGLALSMVADSALSDPMRAVVR
jgi:peptide/nickel transport system permease protein